MMETLSMVMDALKTCTVETGYNCTGGTENTPDICVEICGDGLDWKRYECDDANTNDGDGCSSKCKVEIGWKCFGSSTTQRSTCQLLPQPVLTKATITSDNKLITLTYNETIVLNPAWNYTHIRLWVQGPKPEYDISY